MALSPNAPSPCKHTTCLSGLASLAPSGGWTADPKREKPGRDLGYTRYEKMAEALGCYGNYVDKAEDIRPALERAQREVDKGRVAVARRVGPRPHGAEGARVQTMARRMRLHRLTTEVQHLLAIHHQDGIASDEIV